MSGLSRQRTKAALLDSLKRAHADGEERIRTTGEIGMLQTIRQFNGELATRLSWMLARRLACRPECVLRFTMACQP